MRKALIALLVILILLFGIDRIGVLVADSQLASRVQKAQGLTRKPSVSIKKFPFLTQVVGGNYRRVDVTIHDFTQQGLTVDEVAVRAYGVHVSLGKAISGSVSEVPVDRAIARVTISYQHLNDYLKTRLTGQLITVSGSGGALKLTGTLPFPPRTSLTVDARVEVGGTSITLEPTSLDAVLAKVPGGSALRDLVQEFFTVKLPISQLPFGIALQRATVTPEGVVIDASAAGLTLQTPTG